MLGYDESRDIYLKELREEYLGVYNSFIFIFAGVIVM